VASAFNFSLTAKAISFLMSDITELKYGAKTQRLLNIFSIQISSNYI